MQGNDKFHRDNVYRRNPEVFGTTIDGEEVIMSVKHGQYYGLEGVGLRVWELIEEPRSFEQLVDHIQEEFEVELEICEKDLVAFLSEMERLELIERG